MKEPCSQNLEGEGAGGRERNAANSTAQEMKAIDEKARMTGRRGLAAEKDGVARVKQRGGSDARQATTCSCLSGSECKLGSQGKGGRTRAVPTVGGVAQQVQASRTVLQLTELHWYVSY
jgi:hypothetical protein